MAACLPALAGMLLMPLLTYKMVDPELKDTPEAPAKAKERLAALGPMTGDEKIMLGVMGVAVVLWVVGDSIGVSAVQAAMLGLVVGLRLLLIDSWLGSAPLLLLLLTADCCCCFC